MNNNRNIIGILSVVAIFAVWSNAANASENSTENNLLIKTSIEEIVPEDTEATKVALSVSKAKMLKKYENQHQLSDEDLKEMLSLVGFKGQALREAWAIAKKESNGRPLAFNGNTRTGDSSYGIFQINMIGNLGPDRREKFKLKHNADLFNPVVNARIAYYMSQGGENWISWKGITPRTKEWLNKFPN
jgi:hypothetical protein